MIQTIDFEAFRGAASNGHLDVINKLLPFPAVLAYAEAHDNEREYGKYIERFMTNRLKVLHQRKAKSHPTVVITQQEAVLCFYFLRHLMKQTPSTDDEIAKIDFCIEV